MMRKTLLPLFTLALAVTAFVALHPASASAGLLNLFQPSGDAPEIGADAIGGAIALVTGGLALLRRR